jgi:hypothetical protein
LRFYVKEMENKRNTMNKKQKKNKEKIRMLGMTQQT